MRSSAGSDEVAVGLAGNDIRTIILSVRSIGRQRWRAKPLFGVPQWFRASTTGSDAQSPRYGALEMEYDGAACLVFASVSALLLAASSNRAQSTAFASFTLWALGLTINEGLGEEHDFSGRLALMPHRQVIERAHIVFGWLCALALLGPMLLIVPGSHLAGSTAIGLAFAAAASATLSATISLRARWTLLMDPAMLGLPVEAIATSIIFNLSKPVLVAYFSRWRDGASVLPASASQFLGWWHWVYFLSRSGQGLSMRLADICGGSLVDRARIRQRLEGVRRISSD